MHTPCGAGTHVLAVCPIADPAWISSRSRSPVLMWAKWKSRKIFSEIVPFPLPARSTIDQSVLTRRVAHHQIEKMVERQQCTIRTWYTSNPITLILTPTLLLISQSDSNPTINKPIRPNQPLCRVFVIYQIMLGLSLIHI